MEVVDSENPDLSYKSVPIKRKEARLSNSCGSVPVKRKEAKPSKTGNDKKAENTEPEGI